MQWPAIVVFISSVIFSIQSLAESPDECFPRTEVEEIAKHFEQIRPFLNGGDKVCKADVGEQWAKVIESLIDLKNIRLNDEKEFKTKDDFSFKAIQDNQWWEYFTKRANHIVLEGSFCRQGTVAYVHPFMMGIVNLCAPYYTEGRIGRAEVLLHEVRHFEGFGHVTCSRGADQGVQGACDTELEQKGSYAVSMQANVTLGLRGQGFTEAEKALGRASALYLLHNRFNKETNVKIKESLYLENAQGEVFDWDPTADEAPRLVKKLAQPAKIYTAGMETIIYPMDAKLPAYRQSEDFSAEKTTLGMFATSYNEKNEEGRKSVLVHNYNNNGGFLTETGFSSICGREMVELKKEEFPESITNILTLERESNTFIGHLIGESGRLYTVDCSPEGKTSLKAEEKFVARNIYRSAMVGNERYALNSDGELFELKKDKNQFNLLGSIRFSNEGEVWIEMATRTMPYLFDEAKSTGL